MKCKDLEELLSAYADGELPKTQREFIEEHLSGCAECAATLAGFTAAGGLLSSLKAMPKTSDIKEATLRKIKAGVHGDTLWRWVRPYLAIGMAIIVLAVLLAVQPWSFITPDAAAASIVRNSPEVQTFFDGEQVEEVEVTTKVIGNEGQVLLVLVKTETRTAAAEVDMEEKTVTNIVRVHVPEFTTADEQKALGIASADSGVQELLDKGGIIGGAFPHYGIHTTPNVLGPDGIPHDEFTVILMSMVTIELDNETVNALINLEEGRVQAILKVGDSSLDALNNIIYGVAGPVFLALAVFILLDIWLRKRPSGKTAAIWTIVCSTLGLYLGIYGWPSSILKELLIFGLSAAAVLMGVTILKTRGVWKWVAITGISIGSLGMAFNLAQLLINPNRDVRVIAAVFAVIAGTIVYAFYDRIKKIPRHWWRPAAVIIPVAGVLIALFVMQPWSGSLGPESVMARVYTATENLQSYRLTYSSATTIDGETSSSLMEIVFSAPDRYHIRTVSNNTTEEYLFIGDTQYVMKGSSTWAAMTILSGSLSSVVSKQITLDLLNALTDLQSLPEETINGVRCLHYTGKWDVEKFIEEVKQNIQELRDKSDAPSLTDEEMERMFAEVRSFDVTYELWVGKDDFLMRRMESSRQGPDDKGGLVFSEQTMTYSDFNQPISIEPPLDAEGNLLDGWLIAGSISPDSKQPVFSLSMFSSIGAQEGYSDREHQEVRYDITITNRSIERVKNMRLVINTILTGEANEPADIEAEPVTPVDALAPGESLKYDIRLPFNAGKYTKQEIMILNSETTIYVHFTTEDGREMTELLHSGPRYPTSTPPPPPEDENPGSDK